MARRSNPNGFRRHLRAAYRSGLEAAVAAALSMAGVPHAYEAYKIPFTQPAKNRNYTPDITLHNGVVLETKGMFTTEDRQKHIWVKEQYPDLDIRFIFSNANAKLRKGSPTTYADWATNNGFKWAHKTVPTEWLSEGPNRKSLSALKGLGWTP